MFRAGDYIVYGSSGVCLVSAVGRTEHSPMDPDRLYYTLRPVYDTEIIYTPVDTGVFMRDVMTSAEAEQLLRQIPEIPELSFDSREQRSPRLQSERYRSALQSHNCCELIGLIKTIRAKEQRTGKELGQVDQRYLKQAETLLYGELAVALNIPRTDVPGHIGQFFRPAHAASA